MNKGFRNGNKRKRKKLKYKGRKERGEQAMKGTRKPRWELWNKKRKEGKLTTIKSARKNGVKGKVNKNKGERANIEAQWEERTMWRVK